MENETPVVVRDIEMPFMSMVTFMVKAAFASIPAMVIVSVALFVIGLAIALAMTALFGVALL